MTFEIHNQKSGITANEPYNIYHGHTSHISHQECHGGETIRKHTRQGKATQGKQYKEDKTRQDKASKTRQGNQDKAIKTRQSRQGNQDKASKTTQEYNFIHL
jgi:hypothetical protein